MAEKKQFFMRDDVIRPLSEAGDDDLQKLQKDTLLFVEKLTPNNAEYCDDLIVSYGAHYLVNERTRFADEEFMDFTVPFCRFDGSAPKNDNIDSGIVVRTRHPPEDVLTHFKKIGPLYICDNGTLFKFVDNENDLKKAKESGKLTVGPGGHLRLRDIAIINDKKFIRFIQKDDDHAKELRAFFIVMVFALGFNVFLFFIGQMKQEIC